MSSAISGPPGRLLLDSDSESRTSVLLVQPAYLRILGSHNDRVPLELCYLNTYLHKAGYASSVMNADWSGATKYLKWQKLFRNSVYLEAAARGESPIYDETVERIMSMDPDIVVLAAGDGLTPWVDIGNPYVTAILAEKLRELGVYTVGVGPFYTEVPQKFIHAFDAILTGVASPTIIEIVAARPRAAIVQGQAMSLQSIPLMDVFPAGGRENVVMTALGCSRTCTFCLGRRTPYNLIPAHIVASDIQNRTADLIDFGDAILPVQRERVRELTSVLSSLGKRFTGELSVSSVNEKTLTLIRELGVVGVKLGVESGDNQLLKTMKKGQTTDSILRAVELIRRFNLHLTAYILLGGPHSSIESAWKTYKLCRDIHADDYVVNVWSFFDLAGRDFRNDAHFSQSLVEKWGLTDVMDSFFDLQASVKHGLGPLL